MVRVLSVKVWLDLLELYRLSCYFICVIFVQVVSVLFRITFFFMEIENILHSSGENLQVCVESSVIVCRNLIYSLSF